MQETHVADDSTKAHSLISYRERRTLNCTSDWSDCILLSLALFHECPTLVSFPCMYSWGARLSPRFSETLAPFPLLCRQLLLTIQPLPTVHVTSPFPRVRLDGRQPQLQSPCFCVCITYFILEDVAYVFTPLSGIFSARRSVESGGPYQGGPTLLLSELDSPVWPQGGAPVPPTVSLHTQQQRVRVMHQGQNVYALTKPSLTPWSTQSRTHNLMLTLTYRHSYPLKQISHGQ